MKFGFNKHTEEEKETIILASASPRRSMLLETVGIEFEVIPSGADEIADDSLPPHKIVMDIARQKAVAVSADYPNRTVVACDTMVWMDGEMLGKPKDPEDARRMLKLLSGRTHWVFSGVCIKRGKKEKLFCEKTSVTFVKIGEAELEAYIASGEPFDKAGAYAMQERGSAFVKKINGAPSTVVGLPIWKFLQEIKRFPH